MAVISHNHKSHPHMGKEGIIQSVYTMRWSSQEPAQNSVYHTEGNTVNTGGTRTIPHFFCFNVNIISSMFFYPQWCHTSDSLWVMTCLYKAKILDSTTIIHTPVQNVWTFLTTTMNFCHMLTRNKESLCAHLNTLTKQESGHMFQNCLVNLKFVGMPDSSQLTIEVSLTTIAIKVMVMITISHDFHSYIFSSQLHNNPVNSIQ